MTDHPDRIEDLLAVYALDALEAAEHDEVRRLLESDRTLRAQLTDHRETLALLSDGIEGPDASSPSPVVWERIQATIEGDQAAPSIARVIDFPRRRWTTRVIAAVSVAAVAVSAFLAVRLVDQDRRIDELMAAMGQDPMERAMMQAMATPGAIVADLADPDSGSTMARIVYLPDGVGYLLGDSLEVLPADRTYQLWAIVGDEVLSAGVLGERLHVAPFQVVGNVTGFAITEEDAGGVVTSRNPPTAVWLTDA
jgi:anti-sigma-K factor RskA